MVMHCKKNVLIWFRLLKTNWRKKDLPKHLANLF